MNPRARTAGNQSHPPLDTMMDPHEPLQPNSQPLDSDGSPSAGDTPYERPSYDLPPSNPYATPQDPRTVQPGELTALPVPNRPRSWTPLAIAAVSLGLFMATSTIMALMAMLVVHGEVTLELLRDESLMESLMRSRSGLLLLVMVPQMALVFPSIVAAVLSPVPIRQRLGLVRGHWPIWAWLAVAAATPLVGLVSGLMVGSFMEESESLKQMTSVFREHGQNGFLIPLALMIGATPAFCEELLFRGYIQTRLTRSFGPPIGILVASVLFAGFHIDVVHVIAVFPLGLFLGLVVWRSGSLFPGMMGHFVNNVISVVAVVIAPVGPIDALSMPAVGMSLTVIGAGALGMILVSIAWFLYGQPLPTAESA